MTATGQTFYNITIMTDDLYESWQTGGSYFRAEDKQALSDSFRDIAFSHREMTPTNISIGLLLLALAFVFIEWGLISQRNKETLAARKRAGKSLVRPKGPGKSKLDVHRVVIEAILANGYGRSGGGQPVPEPAALALLALGAWAPLRRRRR